MNELKSLNDKLTKKYFSLKKCLEYLYGLIIVFLPILYQYASPFSFLSLGDFLLILTAIFLIIYDVFSEKKIRIIKWSVAVLILLIGLNIVSAFVNNQFFEFSSASTIIMKMILYITVLNISYNHFRWVKIIQLYKKVCFILCVYLYIQVIYHSITGGYLPVCLNTEWLFSWEQRITDLESFYNGVYWRFRPSSMFIEPGYYSFYVLPCLYITLIKEKN